MYGIVIMLLKVGILLHWTYIFVPKGIHNKFWWTCHIMIWINMTFYVICTFIEIFGCTPRQKIWNVTIERKCPNLPKLTVASAFVNFFSDVVILFLPQKIIWGLHMPTREKFGTAALFAVGLLFVTMASTHTDRRLTY